jgi:hypothetical protein
VRQLFLLNIREALVEALCSIEVSRILLVQDPGERLSELTAVEFRWFPIPLDVPSLLRHELLYQLDREDFVEQVDKRGHPEVVTKKLADVWLACF